MTVRPLPLSHLVFALAGPIVWAAHFFILYLVEAFGCTSTGTTNDTVRWIGAATTIIALAALVLWGVARGYRDGARRQDVRFAFARPLALVSAIAILWSAMPLFLLPTCTASAG
jgi:hypothetical protein